jgi:hypothetical protein
VEVSLRYDLMHGMVQLLGWEKAFEYLQLNYENLELYSISKEWFNDPKYILKGRGAKGDLIVNWIA